MTTIAHRTPDMVFTFTFETYGDAVHRGMNRPPDRLLEGLRRSSRINRLLVANPFRSAPIRAARVAIGRGDPRFPTTARHSLVTPVRLRRHDSTDVPTLRAGYRDYDRRLAAAAAERGLTRPTVITANPLIAGFCDFQWAGGVTFYARDDWAQLPAREPWWPAIRAAYRSLSASGQAVVAVSQQILDRIAPTGPTAVVPNGVEPAEWMGATPVDPEWMAGIPHPRAIYVGTLDGRLDIDGLTKLAVSYPELSIILLGVQTDGEYLRPISKLPNVYIHAQVGRAELVAAVRNADLCLMAHRRTRLTEAMSPLKIYEYLAAGLPVLSTDLPPCRDISSRVLLTDSVADFADQLPTALALGRAKESDRLRFVDENSWAARHDLILDVALRTT